MVYYVIKTTAAESGHVSPIVRGCLRLCHVNYLPTFSSQSQLLFHRERLRWTKAVILESSRSSRGGCSRCPAVMPTQRTTVLWRCSTTRDLGGERLDVCVLLQDSADRGRKAGRSPWLVPMPLSLGPIVDPSRFPAPTLAHREDALGSGAHNYSSSHIRWAASSNPPYCIRLGGLSLLANCCRVAYSARHLLETLGKSGLCVAGRVLLAWHAEATLASSEYPDSTA
ncbi:hypothetical protein GGS23DRAFT_265142 [Durotheca rogersii]|uniref:uncharacterized protein n=1 Tax=Durotheca rogersii TaxID=419775 RepID=UPI0022208408|nr:uncharacterized protein GGS23DRAFT_265142 [Durotheca rogersii]KAI5859876.1 hypothetical protein GGS23DRAFT_265142 [Durotheca rogersii]